MFLLKDRSIYRIIHFFFLKRYTVAFLGLSSSSFTVSTYWVLNIVGPEVIEDILAMKEGPTEGFLRAKAEE